MSTPTVIELQTLKMSSEAPDWVKESVGHSRFIARGSYCMVFSGTESGTVVKISQARADLDALEELAKKSKHYPSTYRRFNNFGLIAGKPHHAIELEKVNLAPVAKIRSITQFLYKLKNENRLSAIKNAAKMILAQEEFGAEYSKSLGLALDLLVSHAVRGYGLPFDPDLYTTDNWGIRGSDELLIIDPLNFPPEYEQTSQRGAKHPGTAE
jgi:hypothetical protein